MNLKEAEKMIYKYQGLQCLKQGDVKTQRLHKKKVAWYTKRFSKYLPNCLNARIIDVPCGNGNILYFLRELGYKNAIGWDLDESRIKAAQNLKLRAHIGDAFIEIKQIKDCDVIFSVDFVEHIDRESVIEFLNCCKDALKDGGYLIIRTPMLDSVFGSFHLHNDFTHQWATNSAVWRTIASAIGFRHAVIVDERPIGKDIRSIARRTAFEFARILSVIYRWMLGQPAPKVWTPPAWAILKK